MSWKDLIELRYKVISEIGVDALEEICKTFRENIGKDISFKYKGKDYTREYGYHDAVLEYHDKNYPQWRKEAN